MKKLWCGLAVFYLIIIAVSCAGSENELPDVLTQPKENLAGIRILTRDGGHLAWSKKNNKIAFDRLGKDGYFDLWIMTRTAAGKKASPSTIRSFPINISASPPGTLPES